jgi:hypothetical protein
MGDYGSGRWGWYTKEDIVEDCRVLNVNRRIREGILREGAIISASGNGATPQLRKQPLRLGAR